MKRVELFLIFFRIGATAFGGPAAHIAMMEDEFVRRRAWVTRERFLDLLGAANLIPGPTSTELALLIGMERAGLMGLLLAGAGFILPAFVLVMIIAAFCAAGGATPAFESVMRGIQPVILAIVLQALINLSKTAFKTRLLILCAALVAVGAIFELNVLVLLLAAGISNALYNTLKSPVVSVTASVALFGALIFGKRRFFPPPQRAGGQPIPDASMVAQSVPAVTVLLSFLKIGAFYYGGGYVLLAFLREEFVEKNLISEKQLMTAIAVGQFTPGPLFTSATFIGYQLQGVAGAVAATVGIFAPAFLYAALSGLFVPRIRKSPLAGEFLDGVNAASCALMAVVTAQLSGNAVVDWKTALIGLISAAVLIRFKINATWLVLAGAAIGWLCL